MTKFLMNLVQDAEIAANRAQLTLYVVSMLLIGAEHLADAAPSELDATERQRWMIDRWLAVLPELKDMVDEVDEEIREGLAALAKAFPPRPKGETKDDDTAEIAAAVDYASMHLWCAGVVPLILVFSEDEREQLGSTPFAHLSALLMSAAAGDAQALEQARELTRKLSEGAQMRSWDKPGELQIAEDIFGAHDDEGQGGNRGGQP